MEKEQLLYSIDDILENFEKRCTQIDNKVKEERKILPGYTMVDLGLPSGTLWATENAKGYYDYDLAVKTFGDNLPSMMQMAELASYCSWIWNDKMKGYDVIGLNGNSIYLPVTSTVDNYAGGNRKARDEYKDAGYYWTRRECKDKNDKMNSQPYPYAYYLDIRSNRVGPSDISTRDFGMSVRLVAANKD